MVFLSGINLDNKNEPMLGSTRIFCGQSIGQQNIWQNGEASFSRNARFEKKAETF